MQICDDLVATGVMIIEVPYSDLRIGLHQDLKEPCY